mmetsp:Transcript_39970/g.92051  ORF Transcript_39970/g.92051 Transcript_39970/m.92051 type:complete len:221 (-) Transcript_39970:83-745(-)
MGCASSGAKPVRSLVALPDGEVATDLTLHVRSHSDGVRLNPSGIVVEPQGNDLIVKRIIRDSPVEAQIAELNGSSPWMNTKLRKGDLVIAVNGQTSIDGMLRALHWQKQLEIQIRCGSTSKSVIQSPSSSKRMSSASTLTARSEKACLSQGSSECSRRSSASSACQSRKNKNQEGGVRFAADVLPSIDVDSMTPKEVFPLSNATLLCSSSENSQSTKSSL